MILKAVNTKLKETWTLNIKCFEIWHYIRWSCSNNQWTLNIKCFEIYEMHKNTFIDVAMNLKHKMFWNNKKGI